MESSMRKLSLIIALLAGLMFQTGLAHAYTFNPAFAADGRLNEWGVTPGVFGASDWVPYAGIAYAVEDQIGGSATYLNPGYGGQLFDAEAMYATYDSTNFYYAIVTGHPLTGSGAYLPGDIALDFGSNGSYEFGIETTGAYASKLYSVTSWGTGLWNTVDPTVMNVNPNSYLGRGQLAYNNTYYGNDGHYVIEGYIPISYFGSAWGQNFTMSWTQTCGNDVIQLNVTPTPEPATMLLFGMGLAGIGLLRNNKERMSA